MKLSSKIVMTCLVLFAGGATAFGQAETKPAETAAAPAPKIAVVNVVRLFDNLKEKAAADAEIMTLLKTQGDTTVDMQRTVNDLQIKLKAMDDKDPERAKLQEQIVTASVTLKNSQEVQRDQLTREMRLRTMELYKKINEAVATYAEEKKLDLVLVEDEPRLNANISQEQLQAIVSTRKVLYSRNTIDITKEIEQRMNAAYEAAHDRP